MTKHKKKTKDARAQNQKKRKNLFFCYGCCYEEASSPGAREDVFHKN
jgi:hypothetical protein